jgi:adenosylhomocysteine nucleosidase
VSTVQKIAVVAALEREVWPLVKCWRLQEQDHAGRRFRFYETDHVVLTCGGIGAQPARRAAEAIVSLYQPALIYSAGFAGALDRKQRIGDVIVPRRVINANDGSSIDTGQGEGILVSFASVAPPEQKAKLADSYAAQAVDMEAAAVARAAEARGVPFAAVKAVSDEVDFALPVMDAFIDADGQFNAAAFALFTAVRPWTWGTTLRLARNSRLASQALCNWIEHMEMSKLLASEAHVPHTLESLRQR